MLEQTDLEVLQKMMETIIDKRITESENLILKEMDRVQMNLTNKINFVLNVLITEKDHYFPYTSCCWIIMFMVCKCFS